MPPDPGYLRYLAGRLAPPWLLSVASLLIEAYHPES
jgi:hypothetical protein